VTWEYRCLPDRDPEKILKTVRERTESTILPQNIALGRRERRLRPGWRRNIPGW